MTNINPIGLNAVIDISHHNGLKLDFVKAKQSGVVAVFHKATEGLRYRDPMYATNKIKALDAGLLWGAYHFGTNERGMEQADFFLTAVQPDKKTLLVLDYEPNASIQSTMQLADAREFVETVTSPSSQRAPGLYSGHLIKNQLLGKPRDEVLADCFLWVAQYGPKVTNVPATWSTWSFWQYTDHGLVDGIGYCDRDTFNGDLFQLRKLWGH